MSTRRALAFSFLDRYAALLLSVASSMFIARLLTPAEIGVFSVTMVLLTFITALRDFGAGQYVVQERELTPDRIRAAWSILLATGFGLAVVVLALAIPAAAFYRDQRIVGIMLVVALNFAINPFGSLTYAWLVRELRFDALAVMRFAGALAGASVSVFLAWKGAGAISLAYGSLASTLVNAGIAIAYRPRSFPWWPGTRDLKRAFSFGGKISATSFLNAGNGGAHELFMGRLQGLEATAYLSRANGLAAMFHRLFMDATQAVAAPMFAKESRERGQFDQSFVRAVSYVTALGWSFFIGLGLLAHPAILVLYGSQWEPSVRATQILSFAYILGLPAALCPAAITAAGHVGRTLGLTAQVLGLHVVLIAAGAYIGLHAVAWAFVASYGLGAVFWMRAAQRATHFVWRSMAVALAQSLCVALITAAGPLATVLVLGLHPTMPIAAIAAATCIALPAFVAGTLLLRHPISTEVRMLLNRLRLSASRAQDPR